MSIYLSSCCLCHCRRCKCQYICLRVVSVIANAVNVNIFVFPSSLSSETKSNAISRPSPRYALISTFPAQPTRVCHQPKSISTHINISFSYSYWFNSVFDSIQNKLLSLNRLIDCQKSSAFAFQIELLFTAKNYRPTECICLIFAI